jgi:hypothetical protein
VQSTESIVLRGREGARIVSFLQIATLRPISESLSKHQLRLLRGPNTVTSQLSNAPDQNAIIINKGEETATQCGLQSSQRQHTTE